MKRDFVILPLVLLTLFSLAGGAAYGQSTATGSALLSADALRSKVESLKQGEVPWRKIEWRTCLIEGLKESREQQKPVVLWIFIDRPIDDERC